MMSPADADRILKNDENRAEAIKQLSWSYMVTKYDVLIGAADDGFFDEADYEQLCIREIWFKEIDGDHMTGVSDGYWESYKGHLMDSLMGVDIEEHDNESKTLFAALMSNPGKINNTLFQEIHRVFADKLAEARIEKYLELMAENRILDAAMI